MERWRADASQLTLSLSSQGLSPPLPPLTSLHGGLNNHRFSISFKSCYPDFYCALRPSGHSGVTLSIMDSVTAIQEIFALSPTCQKSRTPASWA